jgi:hypothetical protein
MRSARAYLAAFGTSGSLLVAAAVAFVAASGVVIYRGWPDIAAGGSPAAVTITPPPPPAASPSVKRLSVILAAVAPRPKPTRRRKPGPARHPGHPPAPHGPAAGSPTSVPAASAPRRPVATAYGWAPVRRVIYYGYAPAPVAAPAPRVVRRATGPVGQTVARTGAAAVSAPGRLGSAVSRTTAPLSPSPQPPPAR